MAPTGRSLDLPRRASRPDRLRYSFWYRLVAGGRKESSNSSLYIPSFGYSLEERTVFLVRPLTLSG
jgi:hypothetical protein